MSHFTRMIDTFLAERGVPLLASNGSANESVLDPIHAQRDQDHAAVDHLMALPAVHDWTKLNTKDQHDVFHLAHRVAHQWANSGEHAGLQHAARIHASASPEAHAYLRKHAVPEAGELHLYAGMHDPTGSVNVGQSGVGRGKQKAATNWSSREDVAHVFAHRSGQYEKGRGIVVHATIPASDVIAHVNRLTDNVYRPLLALHNHANPERSAAHMWLTGRTGSGAKWTEKAMAAHDKRKGFTVPHAVASMPKVEGDAYRHGDASPDEYGWESEVITKPNARAKVIAVHKDATMYNEHGSHPYEEEPVLKRINESVTKHRGHAIDFVVDAGSVGTPVDELARRGQAVQTESLVVRIDTFLDEGKKPPFSATLYHGTTHKFDSFAEEPHDGFGHWLADDKDLTDAYAAGRSGPEKPHSIQAAVELKNPHHMTHAQYDAVRSSPNKRARLVALRARLKAKGHDGIVIPAKDDMLGRIAIRHALVVAAFHGSSVRKLGNTNEARTAKPTLTNSTHIEVPHTWYTGHADDLSDTLHRTIKRTRHAYYTGAKPDAIRGDVPPEIADAYHAGHIKEIAHVGASSDWKKRRTYTGRQNFGHGIYLSDGVSRAREYGDHVTVARMHPDNILAAHWEDRDTPGTVMHALYQHVASHAGDSMAAQASQWSKSVRAIGGQHKKALFVAGTASVPGQLVVYAPNHLMSQAHVTYYPTGEKP